MKNITKQEIQKYNVLYKKCIERLSKLVQYKVQFSDELSDKDYEKFYNKSEKILNNLYDELHYIETHELYKQKYDKIIEKIYDDMYNTFKQFDKFLRIIS
jgi:hypothetical protein